MLKKLRIKVNFSLAIFVLLLAGSLSSVVPNICVVSNQAIKHQFYIFS
jgi:hypothetical protein